MRKSALREQLTRMGPGLVLLLALSVTTTLLPRFPVPTSVNAVPVTVRELIDNGGKYAGSQVAMTGTVILECTTGCWFFLDDGTGKIYIDLATARLHIPQKIGSRVTLRGDIAGEGGSLHILASDVHFPD